MESMLLLIPALLLAAAMVLMGRRMGGGRFTLKTKEAVKSGPSWDLTQKLAGKMVTAVGLACFPISAVVMTFSVLIIGDAYTALSVTLAAEAAVLAWGLWKVNRIVRKFNEEELTG